MCRVDHIFLNRPAGECCEPGGSNPAGSQQLRAGFLRSSTFFVNVPFLRANNPLIRSFNRHFVFLTRKTRPGGKGFTEMKKLIVMLVLVGVGMFLVKKTSLGSWVRLAWCSAQEE